MIKAWHPEEIQSTADMVWCGEATAEAEHADVWEASQARPNKN